jgi:hypothetical protein
VLELFSVRPIIMASGRCNAKTSEERDRARPLGSFSRGSVYKLRPTGNRQERRTACTKHRKRLRPQLTDRTRSKTGIPKQLFLKTSKLLQWLGLISGANYRMAAQFSIGGCLAFRNF